jgi:hypothetical protein
MVSLLSTKFHEILFSSFRGVALTNCVTDRQTDRRIDGQTDRRTGQKPICLLTHSLTHSSYNGVRSQLYISDTGSVTLWKYFSSWVSIFVVWLKITSSCIRKFRRSKFSGNMHNYIWCPYYLPSFMKFCSVVSEELCWQDASEVYVGKFISSKGHNSQKFWQSIFPGNMHY